MLQAVYLMSGFIIAAFIALINPEEEVKRWPVHSVQTQFSETLETYLQLHLWICFTSMKRSLFALNMNPVAGQKKEARESFLLFPIIKKGYFH